MLAYYLATPSTVATVMTASLTVRTLTDPPSKVRSVLAVTTLFPAVVLQQRICCRATKLLEKHILEMQSPIEICLPMPPPPCAVNLPPLCHMPFNAFTNLTASSSYFDECKTYTCIRYGDRFLKVFVLIECKTVKIYPHHSLMLLPPH